MVNAGEGWFPKRNVSECILELYGSGATPAGLRAITCLTNQNDRPSWPGGVAAAKPQTGWWAKFLSKVHNLSDKETFKPMRVQSVLVPPPRRFAPPLLARR